jgi:hypothetical protein
MKTKTCTKCNQTKALRAFYKDKRQSSGFRPDCKVCFKEQQKLKYDTDPEFRKRRLAQTEKTTRGFRLEQQKKVLSLLKKSGCVDCPEKDPIVLDFDHMRDKVMGISLMLRNHYQWEEIESEIAKCEVRCSNCHRRKTARERGYYASIDLSTL